MSDDELKQDVDLDQMIKNLKQQFKKVGEKFGGIADDMAIPSMQNILFNVFEMNAVSVRYSVHRYGKSIELDVFAYNNNSTIIVLIGGNLRYEHIERMLHVLKVVKEFLPEHAGKKFYGILAMNDAPEQLKEQVLQHGIYYAEIHDDVFEMKTPINFQAQAF